MKRFFTVLAFQALIILTTNAQSFSVKERAVFIPQNKKLVLLEDSAKNKLIFFKTKLQVNTDGTPISYHPFDLRGSTKAINTIGNAIAVYKGDRTKNLCLDKNTFSEALAVFEKYRDSDYEIIPQGYSIIWQNVLIAEKRDGKLKPCIVKNGEYEGYYSSATSLKNDLKIDLGECECNNQVNPLKVPALVLVGGKDNIVRKLGASLGDLLIAYNPNNKNLVYAIINDIGPKHNLGEGSVLLNMKLLQQTQFPKTRKDTYKLITNNDIIIAIIPKSKDYNSIRPYTESNIQQRILKWLTSVGIQDETELKEFIEKHRNEFN